MQMFSPQTVLVDPALLEVMKRSLGTKKQKKKKTKFDWDKIVIITGRCFHWHKIFEKLRIQIEANSATNPSTPKKVLIFFSEKDHAKLLCNNKG